MPQRLYSYLKLVACEKQRRHCLVIVFSACPVSVNQDFEVYAKRTEPIEIIFYKCLRLLSV